MHKLNIYNRLFQILLDRGTYLTCHTHTHTDLEMIKMTTIVLSLSLFRVNPLLGVIHFEPFRESNRIK